MEKRTLFQSKNHAKITELSCQITVIMPNYRNKNWKFNLKYTDFFVQVNFRHSSQMSSNTALDNQWGADLLVFSCWKEAYDLGWPISFIFFELHTFDTDWHFCRYSRLNNLDVFQTNWPMWPIMDVQTMCRHLAVESACHPFSCFLGISILEYLRNENWEVSQYIIISTTNALSKQNDSAFANMEFHWTNFPRKFFKRKSSGDIVSKLSWALRFFSS